jgi:hypothetical protein
MEPDNIQKGKSFLNCGYRVSLNVLLCEGNVRFECDTH